MKGGRARSWESLANNYNYEAESTVLSNTGLVIGANVVIFKVLTPINVTRGVVTLQRIRGRIGVSWQVSAIGGAGGPNFLAKAFNIQLMPARGGVILDNAVLDPRNAADQESNRILWRLTAIPYGGSDNVGIDVDVTRFFMRDYEIDVKVSRRYDISEWALVLALNGDAAQVATDEMMVEMRGLYLATDGV